MGNPADAPGVFRAIWRWGGAARVGIVVWLSAFPIALSAGILAGAAGDHTNTDRAVYGWIAVGLGGLVVILVVLGGFLTYRGTSGFPTGWASGPAKP